MTMPLLEAPSTRPPDAKEIPQPCLHLSRRSSLRRPYHKVLQGIGTCTRCGHVEVAFELSLL
jgi:hypothetical protein